MTATNQEHRAGFVAIVGRPNVGKSTLLNQLLGTKLAIVTPKPQTTRHRILGILSRPSAQLLFVDTPGLHHSTSLMNRRMVEVARRSLADADLGLWVIDAAAGLTPADEALTGELRRRPGGLVVALNKLDLVSRSGLLVIADTVGRWLPGRDVVPVSATRGDNLEELIHTLERLLPVSPPLYPCEARTDLPEEFLAAEIIREQVFLQTRDEVPYQTVVRVDELTEREGGDLLDMHATIIVGRASQRAIVLGERGARIKQIGQAARIELERFFAIHVFLELFVKVDSHWFQDPRTLSRLGL